MFAWKEKRVVQETIAKLVANKQACENGANRRAMNLMPLPIVHETHEISQSHLIRYQQLLISIEAKQSTCCLRLVSEANKSRAAVLVFRGRVLGCLYGQKYAQEQLFGQAAHTEVLLDLAKPDNLVDTYLLTEEIVLAAASLFHGNQLNPPEGSPEEIFEFSVRYLMHTNYPGCIVINSDQHEAKCLLYIFGSRIVGVYSYADGWVKSTYEAALKYVLATPKAKIVGSSLTANSIKEVEKLTFSLTGLGDATNRTNVQTSYQEIKVDALMPRRNEAANKASITGTHPVFVGQRPQSRQPVH